MAVTQVAAQAPLKLQTISNLSWYPQNVWQHSEEPTLFRKASSRRICHGARSAFSETQPSADVPSRYRMHYLHSHHRLQIHTFAKHPHGLRPSLIRHAKGKHDKPVKAKSKKEKGVQPAEQDEPPLRLILLRHAKSSWDDPTLADHERPLNKRGRKAAPDVAAQVRSRGWLPDLILSSDSIRTQETLKRMGEEWSELADVPTEFLYSFYDVAAADEGPTDTAQHLEDVVVEKAGDARSVMLVGHNMGWEQAASHFAGEHVPMKTAFAVMLESPRSTWKEAFRDKWHVAAVVKPASSKATA